MNVQCSWKVSDDRPISDAVFYNRETDESDLEDEINVENCVFLKAPDKCEGLYPTVPACQLLISCEPPNQITRISAICEARVLEIYGHHGEYLKTVFNSPLEETENLFVYRGDVVLDKPLSVCSVKFVNLESPNEMWLFGVKIHTDKMSCSSLNPAVSLPFAAFQQNLMGDTLNDKEALKKFANHFLKMGLPSSLPQGAALASVFNNIPTYLLNSGLQVTNNNEVQNANLINSESKEQILEKESTEVSHTIHQMSGTDELKTNASSTTSSVMITQTQSTATQTEENYTNMEENLKSYVNEQIQGINKRFQELEVKLLCKLDEIESFVKPHGVQSN